MNAAQVKSLVLVPKFTGGLSFLGSGAIVYDILKGRKKKLKNVYHRLLLAMSAGDMILSLTFFIGTWAIPEGTPGVWLAAGNTQTCTAQGFFQQFSAASTFYNAYLAIYYVLVIRYNYSDRKMVKLEKAGHAFAFLFGIVTASALAGMQLFNSVFLWCWVESIPPGCTDPDECERGRPPVVWTYAMWYVWMWGTFGIVCIGMMILVWTIWKTERKMDKYAGRSSVAKASASRGGSTSSRKLSSPTNPNNSTVNGSVAPPNPNVDETTATGNPTTATPEIDDSASPNPNASISWGGGTTPPTSSAVSRNQQKKKDTTMSKVATQAMLYLTAYFLTNIGNIVYQIFQFGAGVTYAYPALLVITITLPLQGFWNCLIYFRPRFQKSRGAN